MGPTLLIEDFNWLIVFILS